MPQPQRFTKKDLELLKAKEDITVQAITQNPTQFTNNITKGTKSHLDVACKILDPKKPSFVSKLKQGIEDRWNIVKYDVTKKVKKQEQEREI